MLDARLPRSGIPSKRLLAALAGAAVLVAAALVTVSILSALDGGSASPTASGPTLFGAPEGEALLRGIPQHGAVLGSPQAPVTLVEYADLQCPYCAQWALDALPVIIRDYVRSGRVRVEFRGLAFLGPESETALRAALAAGEQGKLWNALHLLYANQGAENGGWVTDDLLAALGPSIKGLDVERMLDTADDASVDRALKVAADAASRSGVEGTPSFELGPTGGRLERLEAASLDAAAFTGPIDTLLARA
jgi:protein-disulfide isomerase